MDITEHNRKAWNSKAFQECRWSIPVDEQIIAEARAGTWEVLLTPSKPTPSNWFPPLKGLDVLCLASGGGQQAPVLAAAGGNVVSFDNSEEQLKKDSFVAERDGLPVQTIRGDMIDLSVFTDESFDLIFHPCSNLFVCDIKLVWNECFRVLRKGGILMSGFMNPFFFLFEPEVKTSEDLLVKYRLPYADWEQLSEEMRNKYLKENIPFEYSHSLETQIGGQLEAGFILTHLYEDWWSDEATPLNKHCPTTIATRSVKPKQSFL